jgi:hypothetical protein
MKRKLIVYGISLLMMIGITIPTSSAQNFQVTPLQLKQTNLLFNRLEELEIQDSLNCKAIEFYNELNNKLEEKDSLNICIISELNGQVNRMNNNINDLTNDNNKLQKQRNIVTYLSGGLCLILIVTLLL